MYISTLIFILLGCSKNKATLNNSNYKARITKPNLELISKLSDRENLKIFLSKVSSNPKEIRDWYDEENRDIFMMILNNENLERDLKEKLFFLLFIYLYELPKEKYIEIKKIAYIPSNPFAEDNLSNEVDQIFKYLDGIIKKDSLLKNSILDEEGIEASVGPKIKGKKPSSALASASSSHYEKIDSGKLSKKELINKIKAAYDFNKKDNKGRNLIFYAIDFELKNIIDFLMNIKGGLEVRYDDGLNPLTYCIAKRDKVFNYLLEKNYIGEKFLKLKYDPVKERMPSPLAVAAALGKDKIVIELLRLGVDPDSTDEEMNKAILVAMDSSQKEVVEILIAAGAKFLKGKEINLRKSKKIGQKTVGTLAQTAVDLSLRLGAASPVSPSISALVSGFGVKHNLPHTELYELINEIFKEGRWINYLNEERVGYKEINNLYRITVKTYQNLTGEILKDERVNDRDYNLMLQDPDFKEYLDEESLASSSSSNNILSKFRKKVSGVVFGKKIKKTLIASRLNDLKSNKVEERIQKSVGDIEFSISKFSEKLKRIYLLLKDYRIYEIDLENYKNRTGKKENYSKLKEEPKEPPVSFREVVEELKECIRFKNEIEESVKNLELEVGKNNLKIK